MTRRLDSRSSRNASSSSDRAGRDRPAGEVPVEHARIDVGGARDCRCVPEKARNFLHGRGDAALRGPRRPRCSRPSSSLARSFRMIRRSRGSVRAKSSIFSNFCWSRRSRQRGWYRYCLRPAASIPVACRCPVRCRQIQTSVQAGGIASSRMRPRVSSEETRSPPASMYSKPRPRRRRVIPGCEQSTRFSLATRPLFPFRGTRNQPCLFT
jgi:hypothetical protein